MISKKKGVDGKKMDVNKGAFWEERNGIVSEADAARYYDEVSKLVSKINAESGRSTIQIFGSQVFEPRLKAYFAKTDEVYSYSGTKQVNHGWPRVMEELSQLASRLVPNHSFPRILANFYRSGHDSIGKHRDSDAMEGFIVSMTFYGSPTTRRNEQALFLRHNNSSPTTPLIPHQTSSSSSSSSSSSASPSVAATVTTSSSVATSSSLSSLSSLSSSSSSLSSAVSSSAAKNKIENAGKRSANDAAGQNTKEKNKETVLKKRKRPTTVSGLYERTFTIYDKTGATVVARVKMGQASAIIMRPGMQQNHMHEVRKTTRVHCGRVNITLRESQTSSS